MNIKAIIKEIFSDGTHLSSMRIMSFISLMAGCAISAYCLGHGIQCSHLVGIFVGSAFTGKTIQSFSERGE